MSHTVPYNRLASNTTYTDPVTMNRVNPDEAVYIPADSTNHKIRHVYHRSTLNRILNGERKAKSPITRREFYRANIKRVPRDSRLHPELEDKKFQLVFSMNDTHKHTYTTVKPGSRLDFLMTDDNSLTVRKHTGGSSGNRDYTMNVNLKLEFNDSKRLENAMRKLIDVVGQSTTIISVTGTRVVKPASKK